MAIKRITALLLLGMSGLALAQTAPKPKYGPWGVDYTSMDKATKPGDDFFRYAEGSWLKTAPIAPDKARAGYNYDMPDESEAEVRKLVEDAGANPADPKMRRITNFYGAWMDQAGIEARGTAPLKPWLARIAAVSNTNQLVALMAEPGYAAPINIGVSPNSKDPTHYTVDTGQARLGLPTRDYYLLPDAKYVGYRKAYRDYIIHIQELAGISDAAAKADAIIALETRLAQDQWTPEARRDPVKYIDYSAMTVSRTDPLGNAIAADNFQWKLELSRLPKPVDRGLWDMNVQEVNAYYNPLMNQVTFPAAILQPPFFDPAADPAVNYGETGATIGHEMGHGFDDEGRQFDAQGRLRDWWTKESADRYTAHAQKLVAQFNGYEPIPGVHIKGELTLGENLGDLGGLEAAYAAYRRYVARHGEPPVIDGYSGDQRFFIAYAQSWQGKAREGALRAQLLSNPHSPEEYRVNGIVRNMDAWYAAFGVRPGDKLYLAPEDRVHVW
jgi:predicted metalloendopeptidase